MQKFDNSLLIWIEIKQILSKEQLVFVISRFVSLLQAQLAMRNVKMTRKIL
jgi:hypothetical protein